MRKLFEWIGRRVFGREQPAPVLERATIEGAVCGCACGRVRLRVELGAHTWLYYFRRHEALKLKAVIYRQHPKQHAERIMLAATTIVKGMAQKGARLEQA